MIFIENIKERYIKGESTVLGYKLKSPYMYIHIVWYYINVIYAIFMSTLGDLIILNYTNMHESFFVRNLILITPVIFFIIVFKKRERYMTYKFHDDSMIKYHNHLAKLIEAGEVKLDEIRNNIFQDHIRQ